MTRLLLLALLTFTVRLANAAAPASSPSIISVPVVSRTHTHTKLAGQVPNDVHTRARLPTAVTPSHYDITITPNLDTTENAFTFEGKVLITVRALETDIDQIVLHSEDLDINSVAVLDVKEENIIDASDEATGTGYHFDEANSFLLVDLIRPMLKDEDYVITADYSGIIRNDMRGFYRSWYYDEDVLRWMAATHFQPGHARKVFPCFDEPKFKAVFTITIDSPKEYSDVLSNMPIKSTIDGQNGMKRQLFHPTPAMSTYLVAFVISYKKSEQVTEGDDQNSFGVHARISTDQDGKYAFDMGQTIVSNMEKITDYPYYTMAVHMKMDLVAIPDHSDGAMENYGLLAFREPLILSREGTTSDYYKQRIIGMISHEVAHMWFGNLVTCEWWDNLWLNEGFARYYEMFLAHKVAPEMGFDVRFVTEHMFNALYSDSFSGIQPLTAVQQDPAILPNDFDPHSSVIVYSKGASIIRQTQHLLGEKTFEAGLRAYLDERSFSTAVPEQLWEHLQTAAVEDQALIGYDITVAEYFKTWSTRPGFPLLTVEVSGDIISITQTNIRQEPADWIIPITYTTASDLDFLDTKPSYVMKGPNLDITKLSSDDEWVLLNKQATGFYRVNYDAASWDRILEVLSGPNRETIHPINRAQIVNDVFALAMFDIMTYDRALELCSWLEYETEFAPWAAAIDSLDYLRQRVLSADEVLTALEAHVIKLASTLIEKIDFEDTEGEDFMVSFTRHTVAPYLCRAGHPDCIQAAVTKFEKFKENSEPVSPNSRPWVYCNALRHGTVEDFNFLWNRYLTEEVSNEKQVILEALGCTPHEESILELLDHIANYVLRIDSCGTEESIHVIRTQDTLTAFNAALSSNTQNAVYAFKWFQNYWRDLAKRLETPTLAFHYFGRNLHVKETIEQYKLWVEEEILDSFESAAHDSTLNAENNLNWINESERLDALIRFFDSNGEYLTTTSVTPTETTEETTDTPDSSERIIASLTSVAVVMLFHIMVL